MTDKDEKEIVPMPDSATALFGPILKQTHNKAEQENKKNRQNNEHELKNDKTDDKMQHQQRHCSAHIIAKLKSANHALTYLDFGKKYKYGTIRNTMSKLIHLGTVLPLPKECPKRFILKEWVHRPEYGCIQRNDKKGTVVRFDFLSYLESLGWSTSLSVHNLRLTFQVFNFTMFGQGWNYCRKSHSYCKVLDLSYPVRIQCYDTGTVMISIKCNARTLHLDLSGILALTSLLGEVKHALNAPCVPDTTNWEIVHWHLNRDSEKLTGGGLDVHLTFRDFFGDAAQFYYKKPLKVMRAEVSQSPKKTLPEVFEKIIDRDNLEREGG